MKHHIYLIDDDEDEVEFFTEAMRIMKQPVAFSTAKNCKEGLEKLTYFHPSLIFIDSNMPGICGLDCLLKILEMRPEKNYRIIFYSNTLNTALEEKAMKIGATFCLKKLTHIQTLASLLDNLVASSDLDVKDFLLELEKTVGKDRI